MSYKNVVFQQNIKKNVNKDDIQRQRLDDRVGYQSKFQTAGNLIFKPQQQSTLHVTEKQRFNKNHDRNDKLVREQQRTKNDKFYEARLTKRLERDQQRWNKESHKDQKQQSKRLFHQKVLVDNKKNSNGIGYNPINQAYQNSERGQKLREYDESKNVNRYVRSRNIIERNNTGFNIITGEQKPHFNQSVPQKLQQRVEQKYVQKKESQRIKYQPIRDKYDYLDD